MILNRDSNIKSKYSSPIPDDNHISVFPDINDKKNPLSSFTKTSYGALKHGHKASISRYSRLLAKEISENKAFQKSINETKTLVLASISPKQVVVAATFMLAEVREELIRLLPNEVTVKEISLKRSPSPNNTSVIKKNYEDSSPLERETASRERQFCVPKESQKLVKDATSLVVDDLRATGGVMDSHLRALLEHSNRVFAGYIIQFEKEFGKSELSPPLEKELNHSVVQSLSDLAKLYKRDPHILVRTLSFILDPAHPKKDRDDFFASISSEQKQTISELLDIDTFYKKKFPETLPIIKEYLI